MYSFRSLAVSLALTALLTPDAPSQGIVAYPQPNLTHLGGTWVNFESPHVKPMTIAKLRNPDPEIDADFYFLLVCNTDDNAVEIYQLNDTANGLPENVWGPATNSYRGVRVGQDPVSVVWYPILPSAGYAYTANMVGDSISQIELAYVQHDGQWVVSARLVRTENVGDEPMHIALNTDAFPALLYVTLQSRKAIRTLNSFDLQPIAGDAFKDDPFFPLVATTNAVLTAVRQPRAIFLQPPTGHTHLFVLASSGTHHDGKSGGPPGAEKSYASTNTFYQTDFGFGLYGLDLTTVTTAGRNRLGTKNFNMTFDDSGACWVASGDAANRELKGKAAVAGAPTGFLRALLHLIPDPKNATSVRYSRDLNRSTTTNGSLGNPVSKTASLAHCVDVAVFESGATYKVYLAAMNTDAVGVVSGVKNANGSWNDKPNSWTRSVISLSGAGATMAPTCVVVKHADGNAQNDPGDRVYVLNRFGNSITVIDPLTDSIKGTVPLHADPAPAYIKQGRRFLYSTDIGNGFNSCASCHFDGRLDGLRWDLSDNTSSAPFSLDMIDALPDPNWTAQVYNGTFAFSQPKGEMITQSMQGLVNFEVDSRAPGPAGLLAQQTWFSNRPYHWDMDMASFSKFNGAVTSLLGGSAELGASEIRAFELFVDSIHYPPNFEEPKDRRYSGDIGDLSVNQSVPMLNLGFGGQLGLKLFHQARITAAGSRMRSCTHCHALPEGSNNLGSVPAAAFRKSSLNIAPESLPFEGAALRGLAQKEITYIPFAVGDPRRNYNPPIGALPNPLGFLFSNAHAELDPLSPAANGLAHLGGAVSINHFDLAFIFDLGVVASGVTDTVEGLNAFVREFDTGIAPADGQVVTFLPSDDVTVFRPRIQFLMEQVRVVNCGLAVVEVPAAGKMLGPGEGWVYDPRDAQFHNPTYDPSLGALALDGLLNRAQTSWLTLVFEAVPLGTDRRHAYPYTAGFYSWRNEVPSEVELLPMVPNTANERVPELFVNWDNDANVPDSERFQWVPDPADATMTDQSEPWQAKAIRLMQREYFGAPPVRVNHEAPRRFRVAGNGIENGAILRLWIPLVAYATTQWHVLELPLFPTSETTAEGLEVWETAAELDPYWLNVFLMGGYWAKGINTANATSLQRRADVLGLAEFSMPQGFFDRNAYKYKVTVRNETGGENPVSTAPLQLLSLQPVPWAH